MHQPLKALDDVVNWPARTSPSKREQHVPKINLPPAPILLPTFDAEQGVLPLKDAPPIPRAEGQEDNLTPRLLEALGMLDANLDEVDALEKSARQAAAATAAAVAEEEEEEPAWLRRASVDIASTPPSLASLLSSDQWASGEQVQAVASTLTTELSREEARSAALEAQTHHLRASAEAQARTTAEVLTQLELTRSAAQGTQAAARRIVDDHQHDIALLMGELRSFAPPEIVYEIEARLSAPLEALAARKRHAAAAAAVEPTRPRSSTRDGNSSSSIASACTVPRSMSFDRFSRAAADAVSEVVTRARASSPFRGRR